MTKPVRTVAAVHDLSGVGRCALTVAIPVLSAMGAQVCPVPTAVLSAHTGFASQTKIEVCDLSDFLKRQLAAWKNMNLRFDCVYTGYLGSPEQAREIAEFLDDQPGALKVVDPVMGDDGNLYSGITEEMARAMALLCRRATIITPNLTEYACLTGEDYSLRTRTAQEIESMLNRLEAESAVITSVPFEDGLANACRDARGKVSILPFRAMKRHYPGTGDLFASVVCGALLRGENLEQAVTLAADYVSRTIEISMDIPIDGNYGVQLERTLPLLMNRQEDMA